MTHLHRRRPQPHRHYRHIPAAWGWGKCAKPHAELDAAYILSTFAGMTDGESPTLTPTSATSQILDAYDELRGS
jgi:hypothetical protein